ncbi:MAG: hypothetical protein SVU32_02965 [Candidatus Nanohaloarchaea archaeon]|nr:hypothetical protein [Candidatus Nanohaloarchaea archaeon]
MGKDRKKKRGTIGRVVTGARGIIDVVKGTKRLSTGVKELKDAFSSETEDRD